MARQRFEGVLLGERGGHMSEAPHDVPARLGQARGTVNGHPFRSRISTYGGKYYLGFNGEQRAAAEIGDGDTLMIELERDDAPREVDVPAELADALARAELLGTFERLSFTHRREYAEWIAEAKREETRARRVEKAVEMIRAGVATPG